MPTPRQGKYNQVYLTSVIMINTDKIVTSQPMAVASTREKTAIRVFWFVGCIMQLTLIALLFCIAVRS